MELDKDQILNGFKKGLTIENLSTSIMYSDKQHGLKTTKKDARRLVESVILEDYLKTVNAQ